MRGPYSVKCHCTSRKLATYLPFGKAVEKARSHYDRHPGHHVWVALGNRAVFVAKSARKNTLKHMERADAI